MTCPPGSVTVTGSSASRTTVPASAGWAAAVVPGRATAPPGSTTLISVRCSSDSIATRPGPSRRRSRAEWPERGDLRDDERDDERKLEAVIERSKRNMVYTPTVGKSQFKFGSREIRLTLSEPP